MERDIIIKALYRFQDIADDAQTSLASGYQVVEADRRLARLAIKKYNKTMEWRMQLPRYQPDEKGLLS